MVEIIPVTGENAPYESLRVDYEDVFQLKEFRNGSGKKPVDVADLPIPGYLKR